MSKREMLIDAYADTRLQLAKLVKHLRDSGLMSKAKISQVIDLPLIDFDPFYNELKEELDDEA